MERGNSSSPTILFSRIYAKSPISYAILSSECDASFLQATHTMRMMDGQIKDLFMNFSLTSEVAHTNVTLKDTLMDSFHWAKFCRDSKLLEGMMRMRSSSVDLIFTKAKSFNCPNPKIVRKLNYPAFKRALFLISRELEIAIDQLINFVLYSASSGPSLKATEAEYNRYICIYFIAQTFEFPSSLSTDSPYRFRFYDDANSYTGVWKHGGPSIVDEDKQGLSGLVSRGVQKDATLRSSMTQSEGVVAGHIFRGIPGDTGVMESADQQYTQFTAGRPDFVQDRLTQFQALHAEQQAQHLKLDAKLAEEMGRVERDLNSRTRDLKNFPELSTEELKKMLEDIRRKRMSLKEDFRVKHEVFYN